MGTAASNGSTVQLAGGRAVSGMVVIAIGECEVARHTRQE